MNAWGRWLVAWACFGMLLTPAGMAPAADAALPDAAPTDAASPQLAPATEASPVASAKTRSAAPLDVSYIPAEATVAIVFHPESLFTGPNAEWMPVEVITASGIQAFGVDPIQIRETVVSYIPPKVRNANGEPDFGIVIRFSQRYDQAALLKKLSVAKKIEVNGATIYLISGPDKFAVNLVDEQTILVSTPSVMPKMLAAKNVDSPLVKLLKTTDCSGTYTIIASLDAMRDLITEALVKVPPLPGPFDQFRKVPMLISWAKLSLDMTSGTDFSLTLHAVDDQAAGDLLQILNTGLAIGRQATLAQMTQGMRSTNDPVQQASMKYANRIVNRMFDAIKPQRVGSEVKFGFRADSSVATIGVLVALLLPAVQAAREAANRNQSMGKLKQLGLALLNYENAFGHFPQRAICDPQGKPLLSWRVQMLPYLDEIKLYKEFHLDEAWDSPHNKPLIDRIPAALCNPRRPIDGKTNYLAVVGPGLLFEKKTTFHGGLKMEQVTDGTSRTIALVEADEDRAVIWTKPDDLEVNPEKPLAGLGNFNPTGLFFAVFLDDHVMSIPASVNPDVFYGALTVAGGETTRLP